jgi:hypothetical protein
MSFGRNLNCPFEQFELFFPLKTWFMGNIVLFEEIILEQVVLKSCSRTIYFHSIHFWMKKRIQEKVQT